MSDDLDIRIRSFAELVLEELYAMLRLRSEVFVVEQDCPYNDLDGRDRDARHLLVHRGPDLVGCARLLEDEDGAWIGRIAVDPAARSQGVGAAIVRAGIAACPEARPILMHAQAQLEHFYGRFGFERQGAPFLEDGIPHLLMVRAGAESAA